MRYNCAMSSHPAPAPAATALIRRSALPLLVVVTILIGLTGGCGNNRADEAYSQYLSRLGRTLDIETAVPAPASTPVMPPPRELRLEIPPGNLGALDFLAISGCAVQVTIGKRNSSLGRMASASQRLLLDLEYLRLAPECFDYQRQQGNAELADTLEQAWELKRRQLPALIFNATLGSSEYRQLWRAPAELGDYPANTGSAVISALQGISSQAQSWLAGDFSADNQEFELLLGEVSSGDGGALMLALSRQAAALDATDRMLAQRQQRGPLCSASLRPAAADILDNVVRKYFISGIQPRAAALNRRFHELLPPVHELEQQLEAQLPPAYIAWRAQRDSELASLSMAPRRHVDALQTILDPCREQSTASPVGAR